MPNNRILVLLPLLSLALLHTIVDTCALLVSPLWTQLASTFELSGTGLSFVFIVQSMPTSISQVIFGYLRDRKASTYLVWLGPVIAVLCLTMIGFANQFALLCALLIVGGIGVGAFHPDAAVLAGDMLEGNRARGISVFMFGGSLGLAIGPTVSGIVARRWGTIGLAGLAPLFFLLIPLLWWQIRRRIRSSNSETATVKMSLHEMMEGRIGLAIILLMTCAVRLVPNMAMDKVLAFMLANQGKNEMIIGLFQSTFLTSASIAMFVMAMKFKAGYERMFMIGCPLLGIPLLCILGLRDCPQWLIITTLAVAGAVLWGTAPAMVSYAQQLFPKGAGLASALTMGMAWGIGGLIQAPITSYFQSNNVPRFAFFAFTPFLLLAAFGAWCLPVDKRSPTKI